MWIKYLPGLIAGVLLMLLVVLLIFTNPLPKQGVQEPLQAVITHVCDERGVCCYESNRGGLSCIATTIQVVVVSGDVQDSGSQGNQPTIGEVGSRALEERVLRKLNRAFVPAY